VLQETAVLKVVTLMAGSTFALPRQRGSEDKRRTAALPIAPSCTTQHLATTHTRARAHVHTHTRTHTHKYTHANRYTHTCTAAGARQTARPLQPPPTWGGSNCTTKSTSGMSSPRAATSVHSMIALVLSRNCRNVATRRCAGRGRKGCVCGKGGYHPPDRDRLQSMFTSSNITTQATSRAMRMCSSITRQHHPAASPDHPPWEPSFRGGQECGDS